MYKFHIELGRVHGVRGVREGVARGIRVLWLDWRPLDVSWMSSRLCHVLSRVDVRRVGSVDARSVQPPMGKTTSRNFIFRRFKNLVAFEVGDFKGNSAFLHCVSLRINYELDMLKASRKFISGKRYMPTSFFDAVEHAQQLGRQNPFIKAFLFVRIVVVDVRISGSRSVGRWSSHTKL